MLHGNMLAFFCLWFFAGIHMLCAMTVPHFDQWLSTHFRDKGDDVGRVAARARLSLVDAADVTPSTSHKEDAELVLAIRMGDVERFTSWYEEMYDDAWRFARRLSRDADQANDVVQDVFWSIWNRRASWEVRGSVRAYVLGAIRRRALNRLRHDRVVRHAADRAVDTGEIGDFAFGMGTTPRAPDTGVVEDSLREAMRRLIAQLPERQQTALALRWDHELSNVEIAAILGVGEAAVSRLLARATTALRRMWDAIVG